MKVVVSLACWCLILTSALAQNIDFEYYQKKYPDAASVVLDRDVKISFYYDQEEQKLKATSKHRVSILALESNCDKMSLIQLPYSQYQHVKLNSARYYVLDSAGSKVLIENVKVRFAEDKDFYIDGIFYSDLKVKQFAPSVPLPERSLLEYSYEMQYDDLKFLNIFYAQSSMESVENYRLQLDVPSYVNAEVITFNTDDQHLKKMSTTISDGKRLSFNLTDLTAETDNLLPPGFHLPHFIILTKSFFKDGKKTTILESVDDLYTWYQSLLNELNPDRLIIQKLAKDITTNCTSDEAKISSIFKWVQTYINYVAFENGIAGFKPAEAQDVIQLKYGDCKGIANLMVELLKALGFDAHHGWIGTRILPYDYNLPSLVVDNHMICVLNYNGDTYFLDGTDKSVSWDQVPSHIQGKPCLVSIDRNGSDVMKVPVTPPDNNTLSIIANAELIDGALKLTGNIAFSGSHRELIQYSLNTYIGESMPKAAAVIPYYTLKNFYPDVDFCEFSSEDTVLFQGKSIGNVVRNGNEFSVYMNIEPSYSDEEVPKKGKLFEEKTTITTTHFLKIPEGYQIKSLPDPINYTAPGDQFQFSASYESIDNGIRYQKRLVINTLHLEADETPFWSEFIKQVNMSYHTPVVFSAL